MHMAAMKTKRMLRGGQCGYRATELQRCRKRTRTVVLVNGQWQFRCHRHMP